MSKILIYIRQAFRMMREDKLFTAIYIGGTAVAIASAMVVAIYLNIRMGNIAPEENRDRIVYVRGQFTNKNTHELLAASFSSQAVEEVFGRLQCAEMFSALIDDNLVVDFKVCTEVGKQEVPVSARFTDPNFFRLYNFRFIEGRAYTDEHMQHKTKCIVMSDVLAKKMFGASQGVVGKSLLINYQPYQVIGVVKDVTPLLPETYADIYLPYMLEDARANYRANEQLSYGGELAVRVLLKKGCTREMLIDELDVYREKYLSELKSKGMEEYRWQIFAEPHWTRIQVFFSASDNEDVDFLLNFAIPVLLMLLFLLLPAINLSGMVSNRMEGRLAEMGVRKAFGANRGVLLRQVIQENLVLTLLGGVLGYVLSWLFVAAIRNNNLFLALFEQDSAPLGDVSLQFDMFFTPAMFLVAFTCCAVLNLMAALIPSWTSLKRPIVESLNQKK